MIGGNVSVNVGAATRTYIIKLGSPKMSPTMSTSIFVCLYSNLFGCGCSTNLITLEIISLFKGKLNLSLPKRKILIKYDYSNITKHKLHN